MRTPLLFAAGVFLCACSSEPAVKNDTTGVVPDTSVTRPHDTSAQLGKEKRPDYSDAFPEGGRTEAAAGPVRFFDIDKNKYGFKDTSGNVIIALQFDEAGDFSEGLAPVIKGNLHGFIDTSGTWKFKTKSELIKECSELSGECYLFGFVNNRAPVRDKNGRIGYIDREGKVRIPFKYEWAGPFCDGFGIVRRDTSYAYVDTAGKEMVFGKYTSLAPFAEGRGMVVRDGKTGYISRSGKLVIPCIYESASLFSEGIAFVTNDPYYTSYFGIDTNGVKLFAGPFERPGEFKNGKAVTSKKGQCMEIDRKGKMLRKLPESECPEGC